MKSTLSVQQQSVIVGSLLGDGHLTKQKYGHSAFVKTQCSGHREYLDWHTQQFPETACPIKRYPNKANGKTYYRDVFRIKADSVFTQLRKEWYPNGIKIVPRTLSLDPLALAIWYFDDGSNTLSARRIVLATYSFTYSDVQFLSGILLKTFGIVCRISRRTNELIVCTESYRKFIEIVQTFMLWDCFRHKLVYRDSLASPSCKIRIGDVLSMYDSGKTVSDIAKSLEVSPASVRNQIKKHKSTKGLALNNTSGIKGVCFDKSRNKWVAYRKVNGKSINLGRFATKEEARRAVMTLPDS